MGGGWRVPPHGDGHGLVGFPLICVPPPPPCRWCVSPPFVDGGSAGGAPARRRAPVLSLPLPLLLLLALLLLFPYVILCFSAPSFAGAVQTISGGCGGWTKCPSSNRAHLFVSPYHNRQSCVLFEACVYCVSLSCHQLVLIYYLHRRALQFEFASTMQRIE